MPTYEYACRECGEHLEVVQSFKDDALTECPNCAGELRKVFSAAPIVFKGSGWHIKDYGRSGSAGKSSETGDAETTTPDTSKGKASDASPSSPSKESSKGSSKDSPKGSSDSERKSA